MDKKVKNILSYVFWGTVAVVLVYFCLRSVDWSQFGAALQSCRWGFVILSMLLGALVFYIRGCRWRMLLLPIDPATSRVTCFNAYNICMAVNLVLPRAGELARLGYVVKNSSKDADGRRLMSFDRSLGTLLVERIWDALVTLAMAAVFLLVKWDSFGPQVVSGFSGILGKNGLWWALGAIIVLLAGFLAITYFLRDRGGIWEKVWSFVKGMGDGLSTFIHMRRPWLFLLYTAVIWIIYWIMSACIVWALQDISSFAALGMGDAFFLMIAGSISSVIPVPGGFGAYHGAVAGALFAIWGIPMGTGMIFATLSHESQVLTQAVCGLASYVHESFIRK